MAVCWTHTCASMPQRMMRWRSRSFTVRRNSSEPQHENAIFSSGVMPGVALAISVQTGPSPLMYCAVTSVGSFNTCAAPMSFWIAVSVSARRGMMFMSFSCTSMTTSAAFCGVNRQSDMHTHHFRGVTGGFAVHLHRVIGQTYIQQRVHQRHGDEQHSQLEEHCANPCGLKIQPGDSRNGNRTKEEAQAGCVETGNGVARVAGAPHHRLQLLSDLPLAHLAESRGHRLILQFGAFIV